MAAGLAGIVIGALGTLWAARSVGAANREVRDALRRQTTEIAALTAQVHSLEQTCDQPALVRAASAVDPQGTALSPELIERLSASIAARVVEATTPSPPPPPEPTPENLASDDEARGLVAAAIETGHWRTSDRDQLHRLMGKLTPEEAAEVRCEFAIAVNSQQLKPEMMGPPF
jgi:hypothetical protein